MNLPAEVYPKHEPPFRKGKNSSRDRKRENFQKKIELKSFRLKFSVQLFYFLLNENFNWYFFNNSEKTEPNARMLEKGRREALHSPSKPLDASLQFESLYNPLNIFLSHFTH